MKGLLLIVLWVVGIVALTYVLGWAATDSADRRDQICREHFGADWRDAEGDERAAPDCVNDQGEGKWL